MKNWKVILQSNHIYYCFIVFVLFYCLFAFLVKEKSLYTDLDTIFEGKILEFKIDGDSLSFTLIGKEKLKGYYKIKTEEEKKSLEQKLGYNIQVKLLGNLEIPQENTIPNTFNYKKYLYYKHIYYILNVEQIEIIKEADLLNQTKTTLMKWINKQKDAKYLQAFILGNTDTYDLFELRENGVSHLFAVSGMHISLWIAVLSKFLKKRKVDQIILMLFLLYYGFLVGFTASVLRVLFLTFYTKILRNIASSKKIYLLCLGSMLIIDPFYLMDIGFQYSFLISFTFLFIKKHKKYMLNLLKMSFYAFLVSIPITAMNFYEVNFLGILLNLIFVPLVSFLLYPSCFFVLLLPFLNFIFHFFIMIFEILNQFFANISILKIVIPKVHILFWVCYYGIFFYSIIKQKNHLKILFILLGIIKLFPFLDYNCYIYFIDVGQGDSTLFISPRKKEILLLDTGGTVSYQKESWQEKEVKKSKIQLVTFLNSLGISKLSYLILSHGDIDHLGNAKNILENISINKIVLNKNEYNQNEKEIIKNQDDKITDTIESEFFYIQDFTRTKKEENESSLIYHIRAYQSTFLMMGDAGKKEELEILKNMPNVDVVKLGHHGSKTSSDKTFLSTINPSYAIISAGKNNRYNHPSKETIDTLKDLNISYYETSKYGTMCFKINKQSMKFIPILKKS